MDPIFLEAQRAKGWGEFSLKCRDLPNLPAKWTALPTSFMNIFFHIYKISTSRNPKAKRTHLIKAMLHALGVLDSLAWAKWDTDAFVPFPLDKLDERGTYYVMQAYRYWKKNDKSSCAYFLWSFVGRTIATLEAHKWDALKLAYQSLYALSSQSGKGASNP